MLRLAVIAALSLASAASAQTTLYAEAAGAPGLYTLGIEQGIVSSADGNRRLSVRAGGAYWTERVGPFAAEGPIDHVILIPAAAVATFGLGQQFGVPLSAQFGVGAVFTRRSGGRFGDLGESFAIPRFAEALLGVRVSERVSVRAGATTGDAEECLEFESSVCPTLRVGVSL